MNNKEVICHCKEIAYGELKRSMLKFKHITLDELILKSGATSGCGRCAPLVEKVYTELTNMKEPIQQLVINFERS
jgi:NAD(P)H-nitrite reductase large subunit